MGRYSGGCQRCCVVKKLTPKVMTPMYRTGRALSWFIGSLMLIWSGQDGRAEETPIDFCRDVQPVLSELCFE